MIVRWVLLRVIHGMSVRSALMKGVAAISILAGLLGLPLHANSDLPFNWVRNLNSTAWGYTLVEDPAESGSDHIVERFELRMGDCDRNDREDDCDSQQERVELVEFDQPVIPLSGEVWYRWKMYFPENYTIIYPAKTNHIRFIENGGELAWSFETGSTGVFWLGNYVSDEPNYYPLIDEDELLSQWHEFSVHVKWGSNSGNFKVWVNDSKKVDYVGPTCRDCPTRFGYGIIRSSLDKYYQSNPGNELPTQVVYYTGPERSDSGIGYSGYIPTQKTGVSTVNKPPKTLKPVLTIETNNRKGLDLRKIQDGKGDAEILSQD